jgi:hypothetical protein
MSFLSYEPLKTWEPETEMQIRSYMAYLIGDMRHGGASHEEELEKLRVRLAEIVKERGGDGPRIR